jgi:phosphatidylserine decarboxylase
MESIFYIDRITGNLEEEKIYGGAVLQFLYGDGVFSKLFGVPLMHLLSGIPFFSAAYGYAQNHPSSRKKVLPFIEKFGVNASEFAEPAENFLTFNDFFTRKLKKEARPIDPHPGTAIIPADGRYLFYPNIETSDGFLVKGQKFKLGSLLQNEALAEEYRNGTMVIARLCPSDYHRYHFPCDCIPGATRLINGWLFSVNPLAIKKNIHIFTQNKRTVCELHTEQFGKVLFIEIGATMVGSIHQTYIPFQPYHKGDEKGFFSFGASSLILLFQQGAICLDSDLLAEPSQEIKCLFGQSMGKHSIH